MERVIKARNVIRVAGLSTVLAIASIFSFASPRVFADTEAENHLTGPNSRNINEQIFEEEFNFDFDSNLDVQNDFNLDANTGRNEISENTLVEDIATGDVRVEVDFNNDFESSGAGDHGFDGYGLGSADRYTLGGSSLGLGRTELVNHLTGPNSENRNTVEISNDRDIEIDHQASFDNQFNLEANTGNNEISGNTLVGDVSTGDVRAEVRIENESSVPSYGYLLPDYNNGTDPRVELVNSTTGYNSENTNEVEVDNQTEVDINTDTEFNNDITINANTGNNTVDCNTVVGDVSTGNVDLELTLSNKSN